MRLTSRSTPDDADVIRARLRALLSDTAPSPGWVPGADLDLPLDAAERAAAQESPDDLPWRSRVVPAAGPGEEQEPGAGALPAGIGRHRARGSAVRLDPGRRGAWSLWVAGLLGALVLLAWTWWQRPQAHPVPEPASTARSTTARTPPVGQAARTSAPVVVSVVGGVLHPGLVSLRSGARVADAIEAAGGLLPDTDSSGVNLAAVVSDGQQISVGGPTGPGGTSSSLPGADAAQGNRIDLNTATVAELDTLPGIGPVLAQRIVDFREEHGRFPSVEALDDVPGIGPAVYARLAERVRV